MFSYIKTLFKNQSTEKYFEEVQAENQEEQESDIKPLKRFRWTVDYHRIFLLAIVKGKVGIDINYHPIFTESWTEFTEDFRNYMIEYDLYPPEMKLLFERPDGNYINGLQILQSHYSDIKKNTASAKQKIQARETHDVMMFMNKYHE